MNSLDTKVTLPRAGGVLLHPTSLFSPYGIGDLGSPAFNFIKFLKAAKFQYWQILPIGPTGYLDSPYQCISAFAGNPLLIGPDGLIKDEFLTKGEIYSILSDKKDSETQPKWTTQDIVDYAKVRTFKYIILKKAFNNFFAGRDNKFFKLNQEFTDFCHAQSYWLDDFVLYYSLKTAFSLKSWIEWPKSYAMRDAKKINEWKLNHSEELQFYRFIQWQFFKQWQQMKTFANSNGISIIGDMPIFVAHDSVDVWVNQHLYTLNPDGTLKYQAGVPPDYFSKTGQLWGNPLYNWEEMTQNNFQWFIRRVKHTLALVDMVRIDHFRGFEAYWRIDGNEDTAVKGKWIKAPGQKLFSTLKSELGQLPIIAENLGIITPEVEELRKKFGFPGMVVLQFAFSSDATNVHLPHNFHPNTIAYTGTHDNNTSLGWWTNDATPKEKKLYKKYMNSEAIDVVKEMIVTLYRSTAAIVILPMQDLLGEDEENRMNTPSISDGNWTYRLPANALRIEKSKMFKELLTIFGRTPIKTVEK